MITFTIIWNTQNCGKNAKHILMLNVVLTVFRWFIPVVRAYKYIGKWVCTSNTTILIEVY